MAGGNVAGSPAAAIACASAARSLPVAYGTASGSGAQNATAPIRRHAHVDVVSAPRVVVARAGTAGAVGTLGTVAAGASGAVGCSSTAPEAGTAAAAAGATGTADGAGAVDDCVSALRGASTGAPTATAARMAGAVRTLAAAT